MPQLIIPNTYRVAIEAASSGQDVVNVVGVKGTAPGQQAAAAAAVKTAWGTSVSSLNGLHCSTYATVNFHAMDLSSSNGGIADVTGGNAGLAAPPLATNGACALIKWNGGTRSRTTRGRLYWGPLTEAQVDADGRTVASATRTSLLAAANAFISSLTASNFTLVVISRQTSTATPVTSAAVETILASQRRRIRD
jgi:hypothetical protein